MIRLTKPTIAPTILTTKGAKQTAADCAAFGADPKPYRSKKNRLKFPVYEFYNDPTVKTELLKAQHRKCCYCEKHDKSSGNFDIEHFRPKNGMRQSGNVSIEYPGYFWLTYLWSNLLLSCKDCNRKKGLLFPLDDDTKRARAPSYDLTKEHPLFIDPSHEDPRNHIRFDRDAPKALTRYGQLMIDEIGLDRGDLRESRLEEIKRLEDQIFDLELARKVIAKCKKGNCDRDMLRRAQVIELRALAYFDRAVQPEAPFSSMARDYLARPQVAMRLK